MADAPAQVIPDAPKESSKVIPAPAAAGQRDDPLLSCLEYVTGHYGKPFSAEAALNGLPVRDGNLSADLVIRAADRLGLKAQLLKRKVSRIPALVAPFVVLLTDGNACVVLRKTNRGRKVQVVFPSVSKRRKTLKTNELEKNASGYVFYVTPHEADAGEDSLPVSREVQRGHWFWSSAKRFWPSWIQILLAALAINMLGLAVPLFVMNVYDRVIPNLAIPTLWALASGVIIALLIDFLLKQLRAMVLDQTGRRVDMKVASTLFEHAMDLKMSSRRGPAGFVANQIREFETVRDFFTSSSFVAITDLLFIGLFVFVLWMIVGPIAYVALGAVPVVIIATLIIQAPLSRLVKKSQAELARRHSILVEGLVGIEAIKAIGGEGVMQQRWENAVAATARVNSWTRVWSSLAIYFTATVQQAVSVVMIVWGVYLVATGDITIGGLIAANILAGRVLAPLGNISQTLVRAQQAFAAMRGLNSFMALPAERNNALQGGEHVTRGEAEFQNVTFAYPGASGNALSDVSFKISAGERVGIIGRVGSGKTTIGKLLAGFFEPDEGSLLVDGVEIRRYHPADLRAGVGYLAQDPELFNGSIRDNIILGQPNVNEQQVAAAVHLAGVDVFTAAHPEGLTREVGERGRALSGGQRQAITLARMLIRKPRILFLDEPSNSMDTTTEGVLIERLMGLRETGQTLIVCTHRHSMLRLVDRLIVIDGGTIVTDGPTQEVLDKLRGKAKAQKAAQKTAQKAPPKRGRGASAK
ncbi:MAG: type I secretion system permease/ATPase [Rhizobiales bacterium]|nr:type I secretion system permease/ATPase [Hyphomicrobiales bacterium]